MSKQIDLRSRLLNTPLMMSQEHAESFAALAPESFLIDAEPANADEMMFDWAFGSARSKPYKMIGSLAVIPVTGTLLHRFNWSYGFATGYDYIRAVFDMALVDEDVEGIVFDVHSGGGQVDGAFELADHIFENRGVKPSISVVNSHAYSAAYLIGSAAGKMTVPKTGGAGSVGVVTMHADMSKLLDNIGIKITFIHAGKHKVDGNPYQALPEGVRNRIQAKIDESYGMFVEAVARHRGLDTEAVRKTEAQTLSAQEAVDLKLVDAVASPMEAMTAFVAELNGESKETVMADQNKATQKAGQQAADAGGENQTFTQADLDAAKAQGVTEGRQMERDRYAAVIGSEHYAGREGLASKMLAKEALSADEINEMLADAPKVDKTAQTDGGSNAFENAMNNSDNPNLGEETQQEQGAESEGGSLWDNYARVAGVNQS
ncbi:S49 family peptidase [Marinobacter nauticus]|uniref:S49 family peptidase n=1 Tax=Marinobacter nauticus TaxID=2743 RepID=UPI0037350736